MATGDTLSRRERQIMDILYRRGEASAAEVRDEMDDAPSYSAVRATLKILEDKGAARHVEREGKYVYRPATPAGKAQIPALRKLVETFFGGSAAGAAAALLGTPDAKFTREELDRLSELVEQAKRKGTR